MIHTFVILHYKTCDDTIDCVESILRLEHKKDQQILIVIVDNASQNGSIEIIEDKYGKYKNITIIKNNQNLGFAKGNNVGYLYAKENLKADFISILNNDILVESTDYISLIDSAYKEHSFAVLGPDIVSLTDGGHQNPAVTTTTSIRLLKKRENRFRILLILSKIGLYNILRRYLGNDSKTISVEKQKGVIEQCQLHGSFLVYSKKYIDNERYAFLPDTFLYCEEAILFQHCLDCGYKTVYYPNVVVFHKEDSSTSFLNNTEKRKREFVFKHLIRSSSVYRKYLMKKIEWK